MHPGNYNYRRVQRGRKPGCHRPGQLVVFMAQEG
jgi:hypothetical protein